MRRRNTPETLARLRERTARMNADPEFQARRIAAARAGKERKRGFGVPPELWPTYKLVMRKGFRAREAGEILGLLP